MSWSETVIDHCEQAFGAGPGASGARMPVEPASPPSGRPGVPARTDSGLRTIGSSSLSGRSGRLRSVVFWTLFLLAAAALPLLGKSSGSDYGLPSQRVAPEFALSDVDGSAVALEDFTGQFVYLMFGYLNCPDICHTQALLFEELKLSAGGPEDLAFVFIAIDPERDAPETVRAYFDDRGEGFVSLHGDDVGNLQRLALQYHATFRRQPGGDGTPAYLIDHTGLFYLIGPDGRLRYTYAANQNASPRLLADLQKLRIDYELL